MDPLEQQREAPPGGHPFRFLIHDRGSIFSRELDEALAITFLERNAGDQRSGTHTIRTGSRSSDDAKACAVQTFKGTCRELRGRGREIASTDRAQLRSIKDVDELRANVQIDPFLEPEVATHIEIFRRSTESPEATKGALIGCPLAVGYVVPRERVQNDGLGRVEAMAVNVQWIGMVLAVIVGPIDGPRIHRLPVRPVLQLGRYKSRSGWPAEELAQRRGAGA